MSLLTLHPHSVLSRTPVGVYSGARLVNKTHHRWLALRTVPLKIHSGNFFLIPGFTQQGSRPVSGMSATFFGLSREGIGYSQ